VCNGFYNFERLSHNKMPSLENCNSSSAARPAERSLNNGGYFPITRPLPPQPPLRSHSSYRSAFHHHQQNSNPTRQPSLINLDRRDLRISLFQYPLLSGKPMLYSFIINNISLSVVWQADKKDYLNSTSVIGED